MSIDEIAATAIVKQETTMHFHPYSPAAGGDSSVGPILAQDRSVRASIEFSQRSWDVDAHRWS